MPCIPFKGGVVCFATVGTVTVNGKKMKFEFHPYGGPRLLKKNGDPYQRFIGEKNPFWPAFERWLKRRFPKEKENAK